MLNNVKPEIIDYASGFSNWLDLMLHYTNPFYEIVVIGKDTHYVISELNKNYIPNKLIAGSTSENNLPLLLNRFENNKTLIYVCENNTCKLPVQELNEAIKEIRNKH